jgi:D-alanine transaminase
MTAYLNGQFLPIGEAKISPLDRGFLFGDGAYEVIPVYSRRPFRIDEHLRRLQITLDGIRLPNPHSLEQWRALVERIIADNPFNDQSVYIQVTRGADSKRDQAFPAGVPPTTFIFTAPLVTPSAAQREAGIAVISALDNRWLRCDLKTVALLANVLLRQQAIDAGCVETIMLRDGYLTEGAASNIFVVKNGVLLAPQKNHLMLTGITYDVVLELAAVHGLKTVVRDITDAEVRAADELWMTSSTKEVLPIVELDGKKVGAGETAGKPGPVFAYMYGWYQDFKRTVMHGG